MKHLSPEEREKMIQELKWLLVQNPLLSDTDLERITNYPRSLFRYGDDSIKPPKLRKNETIKDMAETFWDRKINKPIGRIIEK